jgi:hypothetical protein
MAINPRIQAQLIWDRKDAPLRNPGTGYSTSELQVDHEQSNRL